MRACSQEKVIVKSYKWFSGVLNMKQVYQIYSTIVVVLMRGALFHEKGAIQELSPERLKYPSSSLLRKF